MFDNYNHIIDNIYLGDRFSANNLKLIPTLSCIISLIPISEEFRYQHIEYLVIPIEDKPEQNIIPCAKKIYSFLGKIDETKNVLICCMAGRSRSASMLIYYIMKKYGLSFNDVHEYVNQRRPIGLNRGFEMQLIQEKFSY